MKKEKDTLFQFIMQNSLDFILLWPSSCMAFYAEMSEVQGWDRAVA